MTEDNVSAAAEPNRPSLHDDTFPGSCLRSQRDELVIDSHTGGCRYNTTNVEDDCSRTGGHRQGVSQSSRLGTVS